MSIDQILSDELSDDERKLLTQLLLMTGREDRLATHPFFERAHLPRIRTIWPKLRSAKENDTSSKAQCNLVNKLLKILDIKTVSHEFFSTVFEDTDFSNIDEIAQRVKSFRIISMFEYGNFRFGYKQLRRNSLIKQKWKSYFPSQDDAAEREARFESRPAPDGLIPIEPFELFALSNPEGWQLESINSAREALRQIFAAALDDGVNDFEHLKRTRLAKRGPKLTSLIAKAGLPRAHELDDSQITTNRPFDQVLTELLASCRRIDNKGIDRIREDGWRNARTYMAMHDLDVYVATSMRAPLHFTTNRAFVNTLFHSGRLRSWNLSYFDPTQAYLPSRIQMGLLECLMIKRTQLTVYHAQESDTFGKDCEAGVTLAQGKPVVVFVTRLLDRLAELKPLYSAFDEAAKEIHRDNFLAYLNDKGLLTKKEMDSLLLDPGPTQADAIEMVIQNHVPSVLKSIDSDRVEMELIRHGYVARDQDPPDFALHRIINLEKRSLMFRGHPLALQASPTDGVARGVIVTRTVADTAEVVSGLLGQTLSYEIVEDHDDWILVDRVTRSPVRVVTKDPVLTSAFWSEKWGI